MKGNSVQASRVESNLPTAEFESSHSTLRSILRRLLPYGVLTILLMLAAPLVARIGSMQTLRTWKSTAGALAVSRPLTFSLQRSVAYVDVLALYPTYRLVIGDGYYGYVQELEILSTDVDTFVRGCRVTWETNRVEFVMPDGATMLFPAKVVNVGP
jgi:hypothetical protein